MLYGFGRNRQAAAAQVADGGHPPYGSYVPPLIGNPPPPPLRGTPPARKVPSPVGGVPSSGAVWTPSPLENRHDYEVQGRISLELARLERTVPQMAPTIPWTADAVLVGLRGFFHEIAGVGLVFPTVETGPPK